jgi:hypothetical protein
MYEKCNVMECNFYHQLCGGWHLAGGDTILRMHNIKVIMNFCLLKFMSFKTKFITFCMFGTDGTIYCSLR